MTSKEAVLSFLEQNRDRYCSGGMMAGSLGVSRNAVWKAIKSLEADGYVIEAVTNRGYRLIPDAPENDILSVQGILAHLGSRDGVFSESKIHIYDSLESTNRTAKQLAVAGAPHGTLVAADSQTAGSGHKDHAFFSPKGGIYMSVLLRPGFPAPWSEGSGGRRTIAGLVAEDGSRGFTLLMAQLVSEVILKETGIATRVKPVNDLYIGDKKVCGILTEAGSDFDTGELDWLVVGIGINFGLKAEEVPEELKEKAGPLFQEGRPNVTRNELIAAIVRRLVM